MDVSKLTPEQEILFSKLTRLQKGVATYTLKGKKPAQAHKLAGGSCKNEENRHKLASEILTNPDVKAFMDSMEKSIIEEAKTDAVMSREEILERLSLMGRTSTSDVMNLSNIEIEDANGNIVNQAVASFKDLDKYGYAIQEVKISKSGEVTIKTHDQKAAMKQIVEMQGYNKAQEVNVNMTQAQRVAAAASQSAIDDESLI
jgi:phage terminase small subunit